MARLVLAGRSRVHVALDEGGLRCTWRAGAGYLPYALLADASITKDVLGGRFTLHLTSMAGDTLRLRLDNRNAFEVHAAVLRELAARRAAAPPVSVVPARNGAGLRAWLAKAEGLAESGGYRGATLDRPRLQAVLSDEHADVDSRAAAAHVLIATGTSDELFLVARTFVTHALPPVVLVTARMAPGGRSLVDDELLDEVTPFLPEADRVAVREVSAPPGEDDRDELVALALARAKAEIARDIAEGAPEHAPRWRRLHGSTGSSSALDTKWVGRTWV